MFRGLGFTAIGLTRARRDDRPSDDTTAAGTSDPTPDDVTRAVRIGIQQ
jgi:hypothetical protein